MDNRDPKTWWEYGFKTPEYREGLTKFLKHAFEKAPCDDQTIACPCRKCVRYFRRTEEEVHDHLVVEGPMRDFEKWYGDVSSESTQTSTRDDQNFDRGDRVNTIEMLHEAYGMHHRNFDTSSSEARNMTPNVSSIMEDEEMPNADIGEEPNQPSPLDADMFKKLLQDAEMELYPGCKSYSKLSFILHLYHVKCAFGWSDKSFGEVLKIFKKALPEGSAVPDTLYETKKVVEGLSLEYEKIDACPNDCMLFWKEHVNANECTVCGASRWKPSGEKASAEVSTSKQKTARKIPMKVMRHFPLKSRLQRLFMSSKTAELMRWHHDREKEEGVLRHPADGEAWKSFDDRYRDFAKDPRNVRLGLASDGFNPFAEMRSTYSSWPVILVINNLPPWYAMKKPYIILAALSTGPKGSGNDIDVYLQPLIDELKELWEGVEIYDAYGKEMFKLRAALNWTINDFPAYGNLSGWSVYGRNACPYCNEDTWSKRYENSGKCCYMGHRRFLGAEHKYRYDAKSFDNTREIRPEPIRPSGSEVLQQLEHIKFILGKTTKDHLSGVKVNTWKKRSIFFELPYWEFNLLRHNLDVMHIEKNVCDNVVNTLLNVPGKSKDNLKARNVLKELQVRKHLWAEDRGSGRKFLPAAPYNLSREAKDRFCEVLENVQFPDGYASNISRCVLKRKLSGLKSHDCHVLMQWMLPLAMRESLHEKVALVLIELCDFFQALCSKTIYLKELEGLQSKIVTTLCNMEKLFPPTFFTISVHLVTHLVEEVKLGGPVHYRWMYPIERFLSTLKTYVGNKARPEGSMAETHLIQECIAFCSRYLEEVVESSSCSTRNNANPSGDVENQDQSLFPCIGQPYGRIEGFMMDEKMKSQAHGYVLLNSDCKEIESLREEHKARLKLIHRRNRPSQHVLDRMHNEQFIEWLKNFVNDPGNNADARITENVRTLAMGPLPLARRFVAFDMNNGYRFRTKQYEANRKTQNSGVMVLAKTKSYASTRDRNPITGDVTYYGSLTDIIELNYYGRFKVVMFKANWVDVNHATGLKRDKLGFTLVNFSHLMHTGERLGDEPFVFASQANQVIYIQDRRQPDWYVPKAIKPRGVFDLGDDNHVVEIAVEDNSRLTNASEEDLDIDINALSSVIDGVEGFYGD